VKPLVLFDGICNLCNSGVNWLIKKDTKKLFLFASLQSSVATKLLQDYPQSVPDSIVLIWEKRLYTQSSAILTISRLLPFPWKLLYAFIIIPKFIRDSIYKYIARNRYRWFGKKDACMIPTPELKERFVETYPDDLKEI
jgi:predicted DCC family thiol-disulfide oxidoreductase YuxK